MPTKDGISGTGAMPGRSHVRREWNASSSPRSQECDAMPAVRQKAPVPEAEASHGIKAYVQRIKDALTH